MGKFGWWYPPGAANDPNAPYNQEDPPCEVCGNEINECFCPECPTCGCYGDPACYDGAVKCSWCGIKPMEQASACKRCVTYISTHQIIPWHHLVRTEEQVASLAKAQAKWAEEARKMAEWEAVMQRMEEEDLKGEK